MMLIILISAFISPQMNIPAFGFAPMGNISVGAHRNDEFIAVDVYLAGIDIYRAVIAHLANV